MTNVLITIETPAGPVDLSVPARVAITDLLELLAPHVDGHTPGWRLTRRHGPPIEGSETLEQAGVLDGTRLALVSGATTGPPAGDAAAAPAPRVAAANHAARAIPDRVSTHERLTIAVRALVGTLRPAGAVGPLDRAARAWEWTNHRRRLEWLLSRPRIDRPVTIGVTGHRSDEVSEALADTLTANRLERVVLVDASPSGALSRRLHHSGSGAGLVESALRRSDLSSIERQGHFGRTRRGSLAVPREHTALEPAVSCVQLLRDAPSSLTVIDCGTSEAPEAEMTDLCDQIVISTTGRPRPLSAPTIVAVWGEGRVPPRGGSSGLCHISDDLDTMLELAVVVADGWADLAVGPPVRRVP